VNIGNPDEISIRDFAEEIIQLTGADTKIEYNPLPVDDPKQRQPDISLAQNLLGWNPKVSRSEGLKVTFEYFRNYTHEQLFEESEYKKF
jgi:dTDP-glucose 4,6-dehydratase